MPATSSFLRRNYVLSIIEGGFFMGGMSFLSMEAVMPSMIHDLGGPAWAVSLAPVLFLVGFGWPQILSALWVERLLQMKPMIIIGGIVQRLPYLLTGLFLIFAGKDYPVLAVILAFLTPFISSSMGGVQGPAYFELITRIVPVNRIASMWAIRNIMMAGFGIAAGFMIKSILHKYPGAPGYGILHLMAFGMMAISISLFFFIKEMNVPETQRADPVSFKSGFAAFGANWRKDPALGKFVITRTLFLMIFIVIPFLSIRAIQQTGSDSSLVGLLVLFQMVGFVSGNIFSGYLGDKLGARVPMLLGRYLMILNVCLIPFAFAGWHFMIVFALLGVGLSTSHVGDLTLVIDFAPSYRRKFYYAVMAVLLVPGILLASGISAVLQYVEHGFIIACVLTGLSVAASLYYLLQLKDPRQREPIVPSSPIQQPPSV